MKNLMPQEYDNGRFEAYDAIFRVVVAMKQQHNLSNLDVVGVLETVKLNYFSQVVEAQKKQNNEQCP